MGKFYPKVVRQKMGKIEAENSMASSRLASSCRLAILDSYSWAPYVYFPISLFLAPKRQLLTKNRPAFRHHFIWYQLLGLARPQARS